MKKTRKQGLLTAAAVMVVLALVSVLAFQQLHKRGTANIYEEVWYTLQGDRQGSTEVPEGQFVLVTNQEALQQDYWYVIERDVERMSFTWTEDSWGLTYTLFLRGSSGESDYCVVTVSASYSVEEKTLVYTPLMALESKGHLVMYGSEALEYTERAFGVGQADIEEMQHYAMYTFVEWWTQGNPGSAYSVDNLGEYATEYNTFSPLS